MSALDASVVVATFNRSERLRLLLESLVKQEYSGEFEVIVVDDGSTDATRAVLDEMAGTVPFRLTALEQPENLGPAAARNRGWRTARAPVVCFTDDDCVASPRWLTELCTALDDADLVQGQTLPNPEHEHRRGPFSHTLHVVSEHGWYETCNIGYRRDVLERLDGFDESFRFAYGEDTELAWRAKRSGARSAFAAHAVILHEIVPSRWRDALRRVRRREAIVQVYARVPGLQKELGKGLFYEKTHLPALVSMLAAVALARAPRSMSRWAASAAVGFWYAWECRKNHAKPACGNIGYLAVVPGALVIDLAEILVLARASVRHRVLQL